MIYVLQNTQNVTLFHKPVVCWRGIHDWRGHGACGCEKGPGFECLSAVAVGRHLPLWDSVCHLQIGECGATSLRWARQDGQNIRGSLSTHLAQGLPSKLASFTTRQKLSLLQVYPQSRRHQGQSRGSSMITTLPLPASLRSLKGTLVRGLHRE